MEDTSHTTALALALATLESYPILELFKHLHSTGEDASTIKIKTIFQIYFFVLTMLCAYDISVCKEGKGDLTQSKY